MKDEIVLDGVKYRRVEEPEEKPLGKQKYFNDTYEGSRDCTNIWCSKCAIDIEDGGCGAVKIRELLRTMRGHKCPGGDC